VQGELETRGKGKGRGLVALAALSDQTLLLRSGICAACWLALQKYNSEVSTFKRRIDEGSSQATYRVLQVGGVINNGTIRAHIR
jgi:hypothetical protein